MELRLTREQADVLEHVVERYVDVIRTAVRFSSSRRVQPDLEREQLVLEEILRALRRAKGIHA
ncbi:MAG: hypothetical protein RMK15_04840 [Chloroflexota bacterium]|jgi:hypothetical protein|nr:hypothetical protein [Dehalococcoidia bacterium]MDW8046589.1 hypothetical protein [Chloroflexota bacterium]